MLCSYKMDELNVQTISQQKLTPVDYHVAENLRTLMVNTQKDQAWTYAPSVNSLYYKEALLENGGSWGSALNTSQGGRKLTWVLNVGQNEMICTRQIKHQYGVRFVVGDEKSEKWVMTADGTTRPAGYTEAAGWKLCKPKAGSPLATKDGIFTPLMAMAAQFEKVRLQMQDNGTILDTHFESNSRSNANYLMNVMFEQYMNGEGICDTYPANRSDPDIACPDKSGTFFLPADGTTGYPKTDSEGFKSRLLLAGDKTFQTTERLRHFLLQDENSHSLFSSLPTPTVQIGLWPIGCGMKVVFDLRNLTDRIDTGIVVQMNTSADGQAATFVDKVVYMVLENPIITYQTIEVLPNIRELFYETNVLGSDVDLNRVDNNQFPTAPISRKTVTDLTVVYQSIPNGAIQYKQTINSGVRDVLPSALATYITKIESFSLKGLCGKNWNGMGFAENKINKETVSVASGSSLQAAFMGMYPASDINFDDPLEKQTMLQLSAGQMYWNQSSAAYGRVGTPAQQQAAYNFSTWQTNGGYRAVDMPAHNGGLLQTDVTSMFIKDASTGTTKSPIDINLTFASGAISAADFLMMTVYFTRANLVLDVEQRQVDTKNPLFAINENMSGQAFQ